MSANAQQIEHWNGPMGRLWAERSDRNEYRLAHIQKELMAFAAPRAGEHVLDIGCGCGLTTLALAGVVAPGAVVGVDVSAPMLETAKSLAREAGAKIDFIEADAAAYLFQPEFDLVFSRFGVMFFADPVAAFANIRPALRSGGRLAFACWRALAENPWTNAPFEAARDLLPPQPAKPPHAPGQFAFADGDYVRRMLEEAGFSSVTVERRDLSVNLGADLEEAVSESMERGALGGALRESDEATRAKIRGRVRVVLAPFVTPDGIAPPGSIWLVGAKR